ncbi:putative membrane transporter protein [Trypanosoma theileri]|uniref:Putative membrane transporter protein n=1 Tax=Trypanosoma theileri TaxID=67003 RepID=A0A1X0P5F0_9TRYP|nr:putative membrane transporter protein [Trypanosoma theileri]ORC92105.1 putative membrane transporter protein [Trypanosoma theileri]
MTVVDMVSNVRVQKDNLMIPTNRHLLREMLRIGVPLSISQLSQFSFMIVMLCFAGHLGVHELGGVSIAIGILNATGFAFGSGLCGALETLLSHSYGMDPQSTMYGVYAQRMFLILMIFTIPLSFLLFFIEPLLISLGEPDRVANNVGRFCRICVLGLPPIMLLELLRRYYASQHRSNPVFFVLALAAFLHPLLQYILVSLFGYTGIAMGWVVLFVCMDIALILYLRISGLYRHTWGGWSKAALKNWGPLFRLAIPSLFMAFSEWTAMEVNSVCAGFLSIVELGAYAISSQVANLCWSTVSGFFMATTVLVGNCIGERNPHLGKTFAVISFIIVIAVCFFNVVLVYTFRQEVAYIFTSDTEVVSIFVEVTPYFLLFHVLDALQCNFLGILRGCGLHVTGAVIVFTSLTLVGTPLGLYLLFHHHYGVDALWIGPIVGCAAVGIPAYIFVFRHRIRWDALRPHLEESSSASTKRFVLAGEEEIGEA